MVKQLFPTPPPPTTTSLYSRRNCDDHGQRMSWFKRQRCTVARGGVPMALTGGRRWSMHTFDAISEDEVVRGERMRRAWAFRKSRETQRRRQRAMQGARLQQGVRTVVVVGGKEWSAAGGCVVCLLLSSSSSRVDDGMRRTYVSVCWCWCDAREVTMWRTWVGRLLVLRSQGEETKAQR
jgi:hypothetical protein